MGQKKTGQQKQKSILILCVDRDDDLGVKAGVKTPVVGRAANLDAAVSLALKDPEESDANAMFEAVRLHDRLQSEKKPEEIFEIATISGSELGGVGADRQIVAELQMLTGSFPADEVILVTDGYSDEAVLPLVESRVPVSSVRRIVIKHSESIEESVHLFSRYLRLLTENPRYSRIVLGLPGFLFIMWVVLALLHVANYYFMIIIVVLGLFLLLKGFGVDRAVKDFYKWAKDYSPPSLPVQVSNYATIAGLLCVAISIYSGALNTYTNFPSVHLDLAGWIAILPQLTGFFIHGSVDLVVVGICTVLFGRAIPLYFDRDVRLLRNAALIISVAWSRFILDGTADILIAPDEASYTNLISSVIVSVLIGIASILVIFIVHRSYSAFFQKSRENVDEFGPPIPSVSEPVSEAAEKKKEL
jgi:putative membrane protein